MVTPETEALEAKIQRLRSEIEAELRELRSTTPRQDPTPPWHVVVSVARVALLGLVLVLIAGLLGLSSGLLVGIAVAALGAVVILLDRPPMRGE
jgi:Flp pilus assembly protein TadB